MKFTQTEKRMFGQLSIACCFAAVAWVIAIAISPLVDSSHPFIKMLCGISILSIAFVGLIGYLHTVKNELLPYLWKHFKR